MSKLRQELRIKSYELTVHSAILALKYFEYDKPT